MVRHVMGVLRPVKLGVAVLAAGLTLSACTAPMSFPVTEDSQQEYTSQNAQKANIVLITPENITAYREPRTDVRRARGSNPPGDPTPYTYRLGVGDELLIQVWTDPERTKVSGDSAQSRGPVIDESGSFFYPFVGQIRARGRTVEEIRTELTERLKKFISDPQVEVAVSAFKAHKVTVTGAVVTPGQSTLTNVPLRLMDVVNTAAPTAEADLSRVSILRGRSHYHADLRAFMRDGQRQHNPIMLPGDLVNIPPLEDNKVFTFGEIGTGEFTLGPNRRTLTEVLASSGGIDRMRADARGVFVFRRTGPDPDAFDVYQFNLRTATVLVLTTDFAMAPLDIVFVTNDPITRWNDTVGKLLSPLTGIVRAQGIADNISQ